MALLSIFPAEHFLGINASNSLRFTTRINRVQYEEPHWVLYDGDGLKPSTNGTWLFVDTYFEILDGMIFKAAQTLFKVRFVENQAK